MVDHYRLACHFETILTNAP